MKTILLGIVLMAATALPGASGAPGLQVVDAKLGKGVKDRMVVDEGSEFAVNDKVYCWVKLTGGPSDPIKVVWTIGDYTDQDVSLAVAGDPWRTWSYKTVFKAGEWTVKVVDGGGKALKEIKFTVK